MKVIIAGGGQVGFHIADLLSKERHDVTLIDRDAEKERDLRSKLDALVVRGNALSTEVLENCDIAEADLFIAVTDSDEGNLIACLLAGEYNVACMIARMKNLEYTRAEWKHNAAKLGIDLIINPHSVVAEEICHMISYPVAAEVVEFAGGRVVFLGYPISPQSPLAGVSMKTLGNVRGIYRLVATAITHDEKMIIPRGEDVLEAGDVLHFVCEKKDLPAITDLFGFEKRDTKNIFVLGGGGIGAEVSRRLAKLHYRVKLLERDPQRCNQLAEQLEDVRVINAAGTDIETLRNEGIEQGDVFIAVTEDEQANILCSLLAKRQGVDRTIALVTRPEFVTLAPSLGVDACISPRLATAGAILKYVRRGDIVSVAVVDQSDSEVMELQLSEDCPILNQPLKSLEIPRGSIVAAIVRADEVIVPSGEDHLEAGDHVVIFTLPEAIGSVEEIFGGS